jgi:hypothetical protein
MTRNPVINALAGLLYIALAASVLFYGGPHVPVENSVLIPIGMLSLFVFSAASMAYIFLYQPLQLFLEGQKKESVDLFLKTLGIFAVSAAVLVGVGIYLTANAILK